MNPGTKTMFLRIFAGLLFAIVLIWLMNLLENVTIILTVAFFLAYIMNPAVNRMERGGVSRSVASVRVQLEMSPLVALGTVQ